MAICLPTTWSRTVPNEHIQPAVYGYRGGPSQTMTPPALADLCADQARAGRVAPDRAPHSEANRAQRPRHYFRTDPRDLRGNSRPTHHARPFREDARSAARAAPASNPDSSPRPRPDEAINPRAPRPSTAPHAENTWSLSHPSAPHPRSRDTVTASLRRGKHASPKLWSSATMPSAI